MALPLSPAVLDWRSESSIAPQVTLYDIEVSDTETLRLIKAHPKGTGTIVYNGNSYLASAINRDEYTQNIEGEFSLLRVAVSNSNGIAGGYIEKNDLDGRQVTITQVLLSTLAPADALALLFTIHAHEYNRAFAVFTLGLTNLFKRRIPYRTMGRYKCQWPYNQRFVDLDGCQYPTDLFESDTQQEIRLAVKSDAETICQYGWSALNALQATHWDVDISIPGAAYIESSSTDIDTLGANIGACHMSKPITGDFDVWAEIEVGDPRIGCMVGILAREAAAGLDTWIFFAKSQQPTLVDCIRVTCAVNGVDQSVFIQEVDPKFIRLTRVTNTFTCYRSDDAETWTQVNQRTLAMDADMRLGFAVGAPQGDSGSVAGACHRFVFQSGGLPQCLLTPDDCALHGNTHRFWGFRGIPRR